MKLVISSEMRVGSRWLHYLLADLLGMGVSPEIDKYFISGSRDKVLGYFRENKIAKFHHVTKDDIFGEVVPVNYKVIALVRNPRDRCVSRTFHLRYKKPGDPEYNTGAKFRKAKSDNNAMKLLLLDKWFNMFNEVMLSSMELGKSTRNNDGKGRYIWTTYEWLLEDIRREVLSILKFLGVSRNINQVNKAIRYNSFKEKSRRDPGIEDRKDEWRRKGIVGDWKNWFDKGMIEQTKEVQRRYWKKVKDELSYKGGIS